jgi:DNA-binding HxlR family transcriptional regulator
VGDKWTLLIVRDLTGGPRRFVELQRVLPGISTEQLRSRLNRMVADGLLTRQRYREVPPRVDYELTERARALLPVVGALARWGARWAWGPPRPGERVDVGAILRAATGLPVPAQLHGTIGIAVTESDGGGGALVATLEADGGRLTYHEQAVEDPDARIVGPQRSWVEAFGPHADRHGLTIEGDRGLAEGLMAALSASTGAAAAAA